MWSVILKDYCDILHPRTFSEKSWVIQTFTPPKNGGLIDLLSAPLPFPFRTVRNARTEGCVADDRDGVMLCSQSTERVPAGVTPSS